MQNSDEFEFDGNNGSNFTDAGTMEEPNEMPYVAVLVPIAFAAIFIVGLIGNGTLIYTVVRNSSMHTKPNVLIVSLAVGDFLLIFISVPFTSTIYTIHEWHYGKVVCKLNEFMQSLSLGVSVFTLAALSADRFIAIVYPFTAYCAITMAKVRAAALTIWVVSILLALVDLIGADVRRCCQPELYVCNVYPEEWGHGYERFRKIARFLVYFLIPVVVIVTLYSFIACVLLRQPRKGQGRERNSGTTTKTSAVSRMIESRKRVAKVVLFFVFIFIVCWFPRNFFILWFEYANSDYHLGWYVFKIVGFCLCFIYSAVNPFALYFLNEDFCHYFRFYLFGRCNPQWRRPPVASRMNSIQSSTVYRYSVV